MILGIDPGTNILGYGAIRMDKNKIFIETSGIVMLNKLNDHTDILKHIFDRTLKLIEHYLPDEMAVEAPFFGKNVQSMLKLSRAQGVVMAAALYRSIPIAEYSPRKIKQSITGNGNASKKQVAAMLENILQQKIKAKYMDATDGLAVATCHFYQSNSILSTRKTKNWKQFIKNNPKRVS